MSNVIRVRAAKKADEGMPAIAVLDDEGAGAGGTFVRILTDGKSHEVDAAHGRVKELLEKGDLVEVAERKPAESKADAK